MFILEFPQNIMGLAAFIYFRFKGYHPSYHYRDAIVTHIPGHWGAISLSRFIFADDNYFKSEVIKHEYGHTIQSKKLLVLYLPIIGIPSLIWNKLFKRYRRKHKISYYTFYTEGWANHLGDFDESAYQKQRLAKRKQKT